MYVLLWLFTQYIIPIFINIIILSYTHVGCTRALSEIEPDGWVCFWNIALQYLRLGHGTAASQAKKCNSNGILMPHNGHKAEDVGTHACPKLCCVCIYVSMACYLI